MLSQLAFLIVGAVVIAAAWRAVTAEDAMRAALALVIVLVGMAPLFIMLGAEFLAVSQVLVYVGAVVVLFLFALMLTKGGDGPGLGQPQPSAQRKTHHSAAAIVSIALFGGIYWAVRDAFGDTKVNVEAVSTTQQVGDLLLRNQVLPFEAISVLLLVVLVGAIAVARKDPERK